MNSGPLRAVHNGSRGSTRNLWYGVCATQGWVVPSTSLSSSVRWLSRPTRMYQLR